MLRLEFVISGAIVVFVGLAISVVGYGKIQPTTMDKTVELFEDISGDQASPDFKKPKTEGYLMLTAGTILFIAGIGLILFSRTRNRPQDSTGLP